MAAGASSKQLILIGIPEIAKISGVGPSAVGNWRKRHADFPSAKVQAPSGALFDLGEIETWLVENGKIAGRVPASTRFGALAASARRIWRPDQVSSFCVACLVYFEACQRAKAPGTMGLRRAASVPAEMSWTRVREEDRPAEFVRGLRRAAERVEELNPELAGLLVPAFAHLRPGDGDTARGIAMALDDATDDMTPRLALLEDVTPQFEPMRETPRGRLSKSALTSLTEVDRFAAERSTPDDISYLLSQLVDTDGGTIFDPAAGECGLLLLAALWRSNEENPPRLVGVEINEAVWRTARSRCYLYELPADIRHDDALTMDLTQLPKADSVVLDPPYAMSDWADADVYLDARWRFGPPSPKNADFAWLQIAVLQLKPSGRAGVVLPAGSLLRGGREAGIRHALIEAGVVEGIVLLPPRLRVNTSLPLVIWLLRSPDANERTDDILLIDASDLGEPGRSRFSLEEEVIDRLGRLLQTWRRRHVIDGGDGAIATAVPVSAISDANLDPRRYRKEPQVDREAMERRVHELRAAFNGSAERATDALTRLTEYLENAE